MMARGEQRNGSEVAGREPRAARAHERTCAGCHEKAAPEELVRVVLDPVTSELAVDLGDSSFGRGAHVHPRTACAKKALAGGFAKSFKHKVATTPSAFGTAIVSAAARRIEGLLGGAKRARLVAVGGDAVTDALRAGKAELVIVARDASAAARLTEVEKAIAQGRAVAWGDKTSLGAILGRDEVAVCAISSSESRAAAAATVVGLAAAILVAHRASAPFVGSEAWWSEVR